MRIENQLRNLDQTHPAVFPINILNFYQTKLIQKTDEDLPLWNTIHELNINHDYVQIGS